MATTVRIKNWVVIDDSSMTCPPPDCRDGRRRLFGRCYDDSGIPDIVPIATSAIISADHQTGIVVCKSQSYKPGQPHPDYEAKFPKARQRLLEAWSRRTSKPLVATKKGGRGVIVRNIIGAVVCVFVGILFAVKNYPAPAFVFWLAALGGVIFAAIEYFRPKKTVPPASQRQD